MKSTEDQDSSDIVFDEVREKPLAPPEVGIFPDGPSVYRSGTVNSNTVNSKFHLIRSFFEIFATFLLFHV